MADQTHGPRSIDALLRIMATLRSPDGGCPWDREQTFATIAPYTLEEAYEVADAIERGALDELEGELGDLLFQVVFHARMAEEAKLFDFGDVVAAICDKLVRRHPHVFGDEQGRVASADDQTRRWEEIKREERDAGGETRVLADVPVALPGLARAAKLGKRAATVGFDWPDVAGVRAKVTEELARGRRGTRGAHRDVERGCRRTRGGRSGSRRPAVHDREPLPPSRPRSRGVRARRERAFREAVRPRRGARARGRRRLGRT